MAEYKEYVLPGGTFRVYPDRPHVAVQVMSSPYDRNVAQKIEDYYVAGNLVVKKGK